MRVKTFQGRTLEQVLPGIRDELGPNAVVLSTRPLIAGGLGGFFGKRMVEVTAADRMPSDNELVDLEAQFEAGQSAPAAAPRPRSAGTLDAAGGRALAQAGARAGGGIDVVDDWDPANDDELAAEFGSIGRVVTASQHEQQPAPRPRTSTLHHPGTVACEPLDLPRRSATVTASDLAEAFASARSAQHVPEPQPGPGEQARELAANAHRAIAAATREIEQQLAESRARRSVVTGAIPAARPQQPAAVPTRTFRAQVVAAPAGPPIAGPPIEFPSHAPDMAIPAQHPATGDRHHDNWASVAQLRADLAGAGVDADVVEAVVHRLLVHRLPFSPQVDPRTLLRDVIAETVQVETGWPPMGRQHRMAFVGASGAGKSSVVAKIAETYLRVPECSVGVVSIVVSAETHATDPLLRRRELEVRFAADPEQVVVALERLHDCDLVLLDTPSAGYLDREAAAQVGACIAAASVDEVHVVMPLATSVREAASIVDHFRVMGASRMVVTKVDESRYAGQLLNYGFQFGLPITFLSDGPRVPEDLRAASAAEIAELIVPRQKEQQQ